MAQIAIQENRMRQIRIEKITLNIGAGADQKNVDKGIKLIKHLTGISPVKTVAKKRVPTWDLRPGLPIGCKLTIRGGKAEELVKAMMYAKEKKLSASCFDDHGNVAFGLPEYIDIEGAKYNPEIGMMGLQACITLERPGFRIKKRKIGKHKIPKTHKITKQDAIDYMKKHFGVDAQ